MEIQKPSKKHKKPLHLHVEHTLRAPVLVAGVMAFFMVAILKGDGKMLDLAKEAYAEQINHVSSYMRQETIHGLASLNTVRIPTISGQ